MAKIKNPISLKVTFKSPKVHNSGVHHTAEAVNQVFGNLKTMIHNGFMGVTEYIVQVEVSTPAGQCVVVETIDGGHTADFLANVEALGNESITNELRSA